MYLQIHEEAYQTLVVNLPIINSTICQKIILQDVAPQLQKDKNNQDKS